MADATDINFLKQAIEVSKLSPRSDTCFSVGAVLVDSDRTYVSSGFTQELGEGWHAEAVTIKKALDAQFNPKGAIIYSSIEPCSTRASGKNDCSSLLIEHGIVRVVFVLSEPSIFVIGQGQEKLKDAGIEVEQVFGFEDNVMAINKHLFKSESQLG